MSVKQISVFLENKPGSLLDMTKKLAESGIRGRVDVSELMGSSVHLHISEEGGNDVVVIVPTNGRASIFPMGTEVNLTFEGNVAHVFSKEDERNLEW